MKVLLSQWKAGFMVLNGKLVLCSSVDVKIELKYLKREKPSSSGMCGWAVGDWAAMIWFLANDPLTASLDWAPLNPRIECSISVDRL
jgi:hypothetical protein